MTEIPLTSKAKRPSFFGNSGVDPLVTMMLEMMTELWVVKERIYTLEKVINESGIDLTEGIEACQFSESDTEHLESTRRQYLESIMRSLSAEFVDRISIQNDIDELTDSMKKSDSK